MEKENKDQLAELLKENLDSSPCLNFTDDVMDKINIELESRAVVKPLIGKSTWAMMALFLITLIACSTINIKQFNLNNYFIAFEDMIPSFIENIKSWWFYIPLTFILLWEVLFRRVLNIT